MPGESGRGARLRAARSARGISLRELARRVNVSPGHISQVERDIVAPSISLLYSIVTELGLSMDSLFDVGQDSATGAGADVRPDFVEDGDPSIPRVPGESRFVQRFNDRKSITIDSGIRWELLAPTGESGVDFREIVYAPGGGSTSDESFIRHAGHELGIVLAGRLHVQIEFERFLLGPGDSIGFESSMPHRLWNEGPVPTRAIWFSNIRP